MSLEWGKLSNLFSNDVKLVLGKILESNFVLSLVGGGLRDIYCQKLICNDLDFEIRTNDEIDLDIYLNKLDLVFKKIKHETSFAVEQLPFGGYRCLVNNFRLEFTPPRLEKYDESKKDAYGHSDFSVELFSNLDYGVSFARRDFTINAIGLELKLLSNQVEENIVDPFNGLDDLKSSKLKNINSSFFYDPVRFLRLIRFKLEMDFDIDESLFLNLGSFNLSKMTDFYYFKEAFRVGLHQFSQMFFRLVGQYNIIFPDEYTVLKGDFNHLLSVDPRLIQDKESSMISLALAQKNEIADETMALYLKLFSAKKHWKNTLNQLLELISLLMKWDLKDIDKVYVKEDFDKIKKKPFFKCLVLYFRIVEKTKKYNSLIESKLESKESDKYSYLEEIFNFKEKSKIGHSLKNISDEDKYAFNIYNKFLQFEKEK